MKTLEPILIDTSLRFGQMDIMQWFPEVTEDDAQSALVAAQEAADAFFSERWSDSTWMLDFLPIPSRLGSRWSFKAPNPAFEPTDHEVIMWRDFQTSASLFVVILTDADYQKPLIEHILREIEETRTREAVEQGRW
jgi:hypothetical protein